MTLKRRFFSAPTLTQALLAAARHHGVKPEDIAYKEIEKRQGFIKAPRGVAIEVDPDAPTRAADASSPAASPAPERAPEAAPPAATEPVAAPAAEESAASEAAAPPAPAASEPEPREPEPREPEPSAPVADEPASESAAPPAPAASEEPAEHPGLAPVTTPAPPAAPPAASGPAPAAKADDAGAEAPLAIDDELREAVAEAIDELAYLASLRVQATRVEVEDDSLAVELEGPDGGRLVARGGRALLAMQHLLPRLLFGRLGRSLHCHLDCDGFHSSRSQRLEELANKAAERVRRGGRSWLLEPMAPDERRLVHIALADVPDIETESVGEGFLKRVRVAQVDHEPA